MKKILFLILCLPIFIVAQNKPLFSEMQEDTIKTWISDSTANFVDKTTSQTITGQKNFSGTVKFGGDTLMQIGTSIIKRMPNASVNRLLRVEPYDYNNSVDWIIAFSEADFIPSIPGKDHTINIGANHNSRLNKAQWGMQLEHNFERPADSLKLYEWFIYFNDLPVANYAYRPLFVGVYDDSLISYDQPGNRFLTVVNPSCDVMTFSDEDYNPFMEIRSRSYDNSLSLAPNMFYIYDTTAVYYGINNSSWLWQGANGGGAKELLRLDNNNNIVIYPSGENNIELRSPIEGRIKWDSNNGLTTIDIYPDTNDVLQVGGKKGISVNNLEIKGLPIDSVGIGLSKVYADPNTGVIHYTFGTNLISNGGFDNWTGYAPDDWVCSVPDTTGFYYVNDGNKLKFISQTTPGAQVYSNVSAEIGKTYGYSFRVTNIVNAFNVNVADVGITITSDGFYSGQITSEHTYRLVSIYAYDANYSEITIDDIRVWDINGTNLTPTDPYTKKSYVDYRTADTTGVIDGYVLKYVGGEVVFSPDISTSGSGTFNPDGVTIDTTAGGLARVLPAKVTKWDSVSVKLNKADSTIYLTPSDARGEFLQLSDSTIYLTPSDAATAYATKTHTHTEFFDTLTISFGVMDTVTAGDYPGRKIENNITIIEVSAYTNAGTVTFNIEERGETTPNTAGTDVMTSDLVADDNQQETTTFSNSTIARDSWLVLNVTSKTGDPTIFGVTIRYVKTN